MSEVPGENRFASPDQVEKFHRKSDLDSKPQAQHHSIGSSDNQASPGTHRHDGTTSQLILEGFVLTGNRGTASVAGVGALTTIIQALVQLGAVDNTTAT